MKAPESTTSYSLAIIHISEITPARYSLETASGLAGVHPEMLRHYCKIGLFGDELAQTRRELIFDDNALFELRRFEHYRRYHGMSRRTLRLLCGLWREIEALQKELRFLRNPHSSL